MRRVYETLSILPDGDEPPREFRIFAAGKNTTSKGPILFDGDAAKQVMSAYVKHGVDIMLDLEHLSLDDAHPNYDPDARGWCQLELRNGELWAVNVKWTPDGEDRLRNKKQRYISPAFIRDRKSNRAVELVNVAICGMPATDKIAPLIAASAADRGGHVENICKALGLPPDATEEQVLEAISKLKASVDEMTKKLTADPAEKKDEPKDPAMATALSTLSMLTKEVAQLRDAGRVRDLVATNRQKFNGPAQEKMVLSWSLSQVEDFIKNTPDLPEAVRLTEKKADSKVKADDVTLTDEERELCRLTGKTEEDLLKHKRELVATKGAR